MSGAQVVPLALEDAVRFELTRAEPHPIGALGDRQVTEKVAATHLGGLAPVGEPLLAILAQRLQQPVANTSGLPFGHDHRLVDQAIQEVDDLEFVNRATSRHGLGGIGVEGSGEHRQSVEQRPLGLVQQLVAPRHRGAQGLVTFEATAA